jgi:hypothetical protein
MEVLYVHTHTHTHKYIFIFEISCLLEFSVILNCCTLFVNAKYIIRYLFYYGPTYIIPSSQFEWSTGSSASDKSLFYGLEDKVDENNKCMD